MDKNQTTNTSEDLNKSVDLLVDELFAEPTVQKSENLNVAKDNKTTADAALAAVPGSANDNANPGRPKQQHTMSEGGNAAYDAKITSDLSQEENPEAKQQSKDVNQLSSNGRLSKSFEEDPRFQEYMALKKADDDKKAADAAEALKKAEDLKKVEQTDLIQKAVTAAIAPFKQENDSLRKAMQEQNELVKSLLAQPQSPKSVTSIDALEKSQDPTTVAEQTEFSREEKLNAAEALVKSNKIPMEAVIELENTGTVYNKQWQDLITAELQKN